MVLAFSDLNIVAITCTAVWNILHTTQLKTLLTEFSMTFTLQVNIPLRPVVELISMV